MYIYYIREASFFVRGKTSLGHQIFVSRMLEISDVSLALPLRRRDSVEAHIMLLRPQHSLGSTDDLQATSQLTTPGIHGRQYIYKSMIPLCERLKTARTDLVSTCEYDLKWNIQHNE